MPAAGIKTTVASAASIASVISLRVITYSNWMAILGRWWLMFDYNLLSLS